MTHKGNSNFERQFENTQTLTLGQKPMALDEHRRKMQRDIDAARIFQAIQSGWRPSGDIEKQEAINIGQTVTDINPYFEQTDNPAELERRGHLAIEAAVETTETFLVAQKIARQEAINIGREMANINPSIFEQTNDPAELERRGHLAIEALIQAKHRFMANYETKDDVVDPASYYSISTSEEQQDNTQVEKTLSGNSKTNNAREASKRTNGFPKDERRPPNGTEIERRYNTIQANKKRHSKSGEVYKTWETLTDGEKEHFRKRCIYIDAVLYESKDNSRYARRQIAENWYKMTLEEQNNVFNSLSPKKVKEVTNIPSKGRFGEMIISFDKDFPSNT